MVATALRRWAAGLGLVATVMLLAEPPAAAGAGSGEVVVVEKGDVASLSGGLAPDGGLTGGYPAAPAATWPPFSTPDHRFVADVGDGERDVLCLDRCASPRLGRYEIDDQASDSAFIAAILTSAAASRSGLSAESEGTAVQAAVWFASIGFVVDADADPAIRNRVAALVEAAANSNASTTTPATVLVGVDAGAPRLLLVGEFDAAMAALTESTADTDPPAAIAALDEAPTTSDTATPTGTTTATSDSTSSTSGSTSGETTSPARTPSTDATAATGVVDTTPASTSTVVYANCTAVWASIGRSLIIGEPGYRPALDRDADGVACEVDPDPTTTSITPTTPTVVAAGAGEDNEDGSGSLAWTGLAVSRLVTVGGALVLGGGALVIMARRRRAMPRPAARP
jgi:hypothetical protein